MKQEIKTQKIETSKKCDNLEKQLNEAKSKIHECEKLNAELISRITESRASQRKPPATQISYKAILIGDSNAQRMTPHLERTNTWDCSENTYKIKDISSVRCQKTYDAAVFLLGTNDIKTGKDGKLEAEELIGKVGQFDNARHKFIIELPPINRRGAETERRVFNNTLHNANRRNYTIIRMVREVEEAPKDVALQDDLHLTQTNAKLMAKHIESVVTREMEKKVSKPQERTNTTPRENRQEQERDLLERQRRNDKEREEKKSTPCRYYLQGRCHRGNRCFYGHNQEPPNQQTRNERNMSRERGRSWERRDRNRDRRDSARDDEPRTRERSSSQNDRRRVVHRQRSNIRPVANE